MTSKEVAALVQCLPDWAEECAIRLMPCVPFFAAMGWDANVVGGNTVGSVWGETEPPEGYRGHLQAHADGLAPGRVETAPELRCPVLMFAVWHADVALVGALLAAGARAEAPCVVDAIWRDGRQDGTFSSALDEARRMAKPELLRALGTLKARNICRQFAMHRGSAR